MTILKTYNFKWVKNLASHLIRQVVLKIGGTKIDSINRRMDKYS